MRSFGFLSGALIAAKDSQGMSHSGQRSSMVSFTSGALSSALMSGAEVTLKVGRGKLTAPRQVQFERNRSFNSLSPLNPTIRNYHLLTLGSMAIEEKRLSLKVSS